MCLEDGATRWKHPRLFVPDLRCNRNFMSRHEPAIPPRTSRGALQRIVLSKMGKSPLGLGVRIQSVLYYCVCGPLDESVFGKQLKSLFGELYRDLVFILLGMILVESNSTN